MKILHILFTNDLGGAERAMATLAQAQRVAGHTVRVLIRPQKKKQNIREWLKGLQVAEVSGFFQTWHIRTHVAAFEPEIIHTHLGNASKAVKKLKTKIPCVTTLYMDYKPKQHAHLTGLMAVNAAQVEAAQTQGFTGKIAVLPVASQPLRIVDEREKSALRKADDLSEQHLIGSVGRLHKNKGMAELITAFQHANLGDDVGLVIVGDGADYDALRKVVGDDTRIHMVGVQTDLAPWYGMFDVYVSASFSETYGLTLVEAMQAGCPILSTKTAGAQTVLAGQPVAWATHATLCDTLQQVNLGVGRVRYDLGGFGVDVVVGKVLRFYGEIGQ